MFDNMAKILISLIGDQTAPNLFLIRDERFRSIDRHVFITTEKMESRRRLTHLLAATGIPESNYQKVLVSADDFEEIRQKMAALELSREHEYFLNLTSGTKIMSLGLYHYFTQQGYRVRIFYLPFRQNAYRQFFPLDQQETVALSYQISLEEYLTSYGIQREAEPELWMGPPNLTERLLKGFISEAPSGEVPPWEWANRIRPAYNRGKGEEAIYLKDISGLESWLQEIGFLPEEEGKLSPAQTRYLIGGWLEQWAARMIQEQLQLPKAAVGLGVKIRPQRLDLEGFGRNEFDVMFIYRNTLYLLECKTGLGRQVRKKEPPELFDPALYQLAALRMEFGMNVYTGLLTPDKRLRQTRREWKWTPVAATRAELLKVNIIDRYELLQGPEHWVRQLVGQTEPLTGRPR